MRRTTAISMALLLVLTGCGTAPESSDDGPEIVRIGFITKFPAAFYDEMITGASNYAAAHPEVRVTFVRSDSATDDAGQSTLIDDMVRQRMHAIVVTPTSPQVQPALQRAVDAGLKVVLLDNDIPDWRDKTAVVATDNLAGGKLAGAWLAGRLEPGAKVGILQGRVDSPSLTARVNGVKAAFVGQFPIVAEPETDCDEAKGRDAVKAMLLAHPDIAAIFGACGPPVLGAIQALKAAGRQPGEVLLVGFDALPKEVEAIAAGHESASVAQFPAEMGLIGLQTAVVAVRGSNVGMHVDTGSDLVTSNNYYRWLR
jgi:ribose transport system substrate-binding protein